MDLVGVIQTMITISCQIFQDDIFDDNARTYLWYIRTHRDYKMRVWTHLQRFQTSKESSSL
jgi:hypothetical protein